MPCFSTVPAAVPTFYEAMRDRDAAKLVGALDADFVVKASDGMPLGVGRTHRGATNAWRDLWAVVHGCYDIAPVPTEAWSVDDGSGVVVHGWYEGVNRRTALPVWAEFVHLLRVERDVIVELRQITDTVAWGTP